MALAVFVQHTTTLLVIPTPRVPRPLMASYGDLFPWLWNLNAVIYTFFVLSGYLIGRPFLRFLLDAGKRPDLLAYARNRALRIVPAFLVAFVLTLVVFRPSSSAADLLSVPALLGVPSPSLLDQYAGLYWSVHVEAVFYVGLGLAFLALAPLVRRPRAVRVAVLLALCVVVAGLSGADRLLGGQQAWNRQEFGQSLFGFVPGLVLALLEPLLVPRLRGLRWARVIPIGLALGCLAGYVILAVTGEERVLVRTGAYLLLSGGAVGGALTAQWLGRRPSRLLDRRPLHWLGERSYSFYLLHYLVLLLVAPLAVATGHLTTGWAVMVGLGLPLTLALAAVSFRWLERPFLKRRPRPEPAGLTPAAYP